MVHFQGVTLQPMLELRREIDTKVGQRSKIYFTDISALPFLGYDYHNYLNANSVLVKNLRVLATYSYPCILYNRIL